MAGCYNVVGIRGRKLRAEKQERERKGMEEKRKEGGKKVRERKAGHSSILTYLSRGARRDLSE